jgi:hypothetical protein
MQEIKYIVDKKGNKISAIVPVIEWEKQRDAYRKLQNKIDVLLGIQESLKEIKQSKHTNEKLQTLSEFLNESGS